VRLLFTDEAAFGRISDPKNCWCQSGTRPDIHTQQVREYFDAYGAVEPETGDKHFHVEMPSEKQPRKRGRRKKGEPPPQDPPKEKGAKSRAFNNFLRQLSDKYPTDFLVIACDNAWWHKSQYTVIPENIRLIYIPPYTPEMNPIEQIWREIRTMGFHNKYFKTLLKVKENFYETIANLSPDKIKSITQRDWLPSSVKSIAA